MPLEILNIACPTCGARQALSDECRRCKCDLGLVAAIHRRRAALREKSLRDLRDGQAEQALASVRELAAISPDEEAARLLAVCHLAAGRYGAALAASLARE